MRAPSAPLNDDAVKAGGTGGSFWGRQLSAPALPRGDMPALAALGALVLFLFHECVFLGRVLYKWDIHLFWYPQAEGFVDTIFAGALPVWNPAVAFGRPMLADANYQIFYPATWLHLLLTPGRVHLLVLLAHCMLTAVGALLLARRLGCARWAACAGAALWLCSGPLLSLVYVWNHFTAACWIPWGFLAADRAREHRDVRASLLWGASLAAPVLAGSPDVAVYLTLATAGYVLAARDGWSLRNGGRLAPLGLTLVAGVAALGLSAAQWMPSFAVAQHSRRAALPQGTLTAWAVQPALLAQTLEPLFPSTLPLTSDAREALFASRDPFLASLYLGLPSLGLVLAALVAGEARAARRLAFLAAAFVLLALGHHVPLYQALSVVVVPLRVLRYPEKAMVMVAFLWAMLAALGIEAWSRPAFDSARWRRFSVAVALAASTLPALAGALWLWRAPEWWGQRWLVAGVAPGTLMPAAARLGWAAAAGGAALALLALRRRLGGQTSALVVATVAVAELTLTNRAVNPDGPREIYATPSSVAELVRGEGPTRVYVYDYLLPGKSERYLKRADPYRIVRAPPGWSADETRALAMRIISFPPAAQAWRLEGSYDIDILELYPPWLADLMDLLRAEEGRPTHLRLLKMAGVGHVVALHEEGLQDLERAAIVPSFFVEPLRVFRVPAPAPRCYAVSGARIASGTAAFIALRDPGWVPEDEVILSEGAPSPIDKSFHGAARLLERKPDRVRIEADLSSPGFVVLLDGYDDGWSATVDGRPAALQRANVAFRAVAVGAGKHVIEHTYHAPGAGTGVLVSLVSAALAGFGCLRRRSARGSA